MLEFEGQTTVTGSTTIDQPVALLLEQTVSIPTSEGSPAAPTLDGDGVEVSAESGVLVGGSVSGALSINNGASLTVNPVNSVAGVRCRYASC